MKSEQIEEFVERALDSNLYCAETVLLAVAQSLKIDSPIVPRIASGFCSGVSRTGSTCGAVNGGIMALGLLYGRDKGEEPPDGAYDKVQEFTRQFENTYGSCNCRDLTGCDLSTKEGRDQFFQKEKWNQCQEYVRKAVSIIAQLAAASG